MQGPTCKERHLEVHTVHGLKHILSSVIWPSSSLFPLRIRFGGNQGSPSSRRGTGRRREWEEKDRPGLPGAVFSRSARERPDVHTYIHTHYLVTSTYTHTSTVDEEDNSTTTVSTAGILEYFLHGQCERAGPAHNESASTLQPIPPSPSPSACPR